MNKDNAHLYLPFVQALKDGKTVQVNHNFRNSDLKPVWESSPETAFTLPPEAYRIKPEPREVWVVVSQSGVISTLAQSEEDARRFVQTATGYTHFRAVEVMQ